MPAASTPRPCCFRVGPNHSIRKGEIALDERGLVGRVTEVGARTARVLLITDLNSRIPVILEHSRAHAILVGTNGSRPRLLYWPEGSAPREGERVVTSAEANAFPADLPVGTVHYTSNNVPEVVPTAMLDRLEMVRVFDYGLTGMDDPEAAARAVTGARLLIWPAPISFPASARAPRSAAGSTSPRATAFRQLHRAADAADPASRSASPTRLCCCPPSRCPASTSGRCSVPLPCRRRWFS